MSLGVPPIKVSSYVGLAEGLQALTEVAMIHIVGPYLVPVLR
jgi:hypothetical protein